LRTRCPWTVQRRNFVSKQSWKFEKDNFVISILEKRVISTIHKFLFGKTCCHNDSWGLGIFEFYLEKRFKIFLNLKRRGPQTSKNRKNMTN
jgi:hypothetical protein